MRQSLLQLKEHIKDKTLTILPVAEFHPKQPLTLPHLAILRQDPAHNRAHFLNRDQEGFLSQKDKIKL